MRSIAFFRNLNQGQRGSPTSAIVADAFVRAGASDVVLFQSNGTVAFSAEYPDRCAQTAAKEIQAASVWHDVVFVRSLEWIIEIVRDAVSDGQLIARTELTLFDEAFWPAGVYPVAGRRCTILSGGPGFALCLNDHGAESNGTPTLERMLGVKVTSRGLPTLRRLGDRKDSHRSSSRGNQQP